MNTPVDNFVARSRAWTPDMARLRETLLACGQGAA